MSKVRNSLLSVHPLQHSVIIKLGKTISPGQDVHCLVSSVPSFPAEKGLFKVIQDDYDSYSPLVESAESPRELWRCGGWVLTQTISLRQGRRGIFITQYSPIRSSTVNYSPAEPNTVHYSPTQPIAAQHSQAQPSTAQYSPVQTSLAQYSQLKPSRAQYSPVQLPIVHYSPTPQCSLAQPSTAQQSLVQLRIAH